MIRGKGGGHRETEEAGGARGEWPARQMDVARTRTKGRVSNCLARHECPGTAIRTGSVWHYHVRIETLDLCVH